MTRYLPPNSDRVQTAPSDLDVVQRRRIARAARRARQRKLRAIATGDVDTEPESEGVPHGRLILLAEHVNRGRQ